MPLPRCREMCTRLRLLCRPSPGDDTESEEDVGTSEDWAWFEQQQQHEHEYDCLHFPPGLLCCGAVTDTSTVSSDPDLESTTDGSEADAPGGFPRRAEKGQHHCWDEASSSEVPVRGKSYLQSQLKEPSKSPMLELARVDLFKCDKEIVQYAEHPRGHVKHLRQQGDSRFLFVLNLRMRPLQLVIVWAVPAGADWQGDPEGVLFDSFCRTMSDATRSAHLKLLPKVVEGPWLITKLVPPKPFLVAKQCTTQYFAHEKCIETSVDCSTAALGKKLTAMLTDGSCVLELFGILEGKTKEELPERVFGAAAIIRGQAANIRTFDGG